MSEDIYSDEGTVFAETNSTGHSSGPHLRFVNNSPMVPRDRYALQNLAEEIHGTAAAKGFWGKPEMMDKYAAKLALVHSEVTEILEALRKRQGAHKVTEEVADVFIRMLDLFDVLVEADEADPDLDGILAEKIEANERRPALHGHRWG